MKKKFKVLDMVGCQIWCGHGPKGEDVIYVPEAENFTALRLNALQRNLAKHGREEGLADIEFTKQRGEEAVDVSDWSWVYETDLEDALYALRVHKYRRPDLTEEEKIERVMQILAPYNATHASCEFAIKVLKGEER